MMFETRRWNLPLRTWPTLLLVLATTAAAVESVAPVAAPQTLGTFPACETSAVRWLACAPGADHRCAIVGDNELLGKDEVPAGQPRTNLFGFEQTPDGLLAKQQPMTLVLANAKKIDDIEAIEALDGTLLVFGSHSRKSFKRQCEIDKDRLAFAVLERSGSTLKGTVVLTPPDQWSTMLSDGGCREQLITVASADPAHAMADQICQTIAAAHAAATQTEQDCSRAFNIEGVVALPDTNGVPRVWVGLRSPLVGAKAVLLRLHDLTALRFDAVALVDLGGSGVRDLAYARDALWLLGGPMGDAQTPGTLWRVTASELTNGASPAATRVTSVDPLPPFSEGLTIDDASGEMLVVVDGELGTGTCTTPAQQLRRTL
ncbi:MAG: DUF3616 domain-containing protein, partial [Deltaproteobacteria bacterium]|nr:DUF3616 domain-containing protein [Deltaproteobacteria bacterium]